MLSATLGEQLAAKQAAEQSRRENIATDIERKFKLNQALADGVKIARINQRNEIDAAIKQEAQRARLRSMTPKAIRVHRDRLVWEILQNTQTVVRKDGSRYMRAKPGKKATVARLQQATKVYSFFCRPKHGYPAPPWRRDASYPEGGTWGHVRGNEVAAIQGEYNRLYMYARNVYEQESNTPRVYSMCEHLKRLHRKLQILGSESNVRRQQGTRYYRKVSDAR